MRNQIRGRVSKLEDQRPQMTLVYAKHPTSQGSNASDLQSVLIAGFPGRFHRLDCETGGEFLRRVGELAPGKIDYRAVPDELLLETFIAVKSSLECKTGRSLDELLKNDPQ